MAGEAANDDALGTVVVFAPMPSELKPVVRAFRLEPARIGGVDLHAGTFDGFRVVASPTGMGTRRSTEAADRALDATAANHVLVVGIAGGITARIGDVVVPEVVIDGATGSEFRPFAWGDTAASGRLRTSDEFIVDRERIRRMGREGIVAVDMETAAIAATCTDRGLPWSTFRVISDMADESEEAIIGLAHADGRPNLPAALKFMARKPWRVPYLVRLAREATTAARVAARTAAQATTEEARRRHAERR